MHGREHRKKRAKLDHLPSEEPTDIGIFSRVLTRDTATLSLRAEGGAPGVVVEMSGEDFGKKVKRASFAWVPFSFELLVWGVWGALV